MPDRRWCAYPERSRREGRGLFATKRRNGGTRGYGEAYIKSVASVQKTWRERAEFRLDQLFHGRASALRALGILLGMSSNVAWSTSRYSVLPGTDLRALPPRCMPCVSQSLHQPPAHSRRRTPNALRCTGHVCALQPAHSRARQRASPTGEIVESARSRVLGGTSVQVSYLGVGH